MSFCNQDHQFYMKIVPYLPASADIPKLTQQHELDIVLFPHTVLVLENIKNEWKQCRSIISI